jgi:uncharacterized protein
MRIIDAHAHFFPDRMFAAIWGFFEARGWPIAMKRPVAELAEHLRAQGVERFTTLNYVKQPGQAAALNDWTAEFCAAMPAAIPLGTVHAGDADPWGTVRRHLEDGFRGVKLQPLVSEFGVDDERLEPVLAGLEEMDKILIVHAGTAPYANPVLGLDRLERVLTRHPRLRVVCPHMGAFEVDKAFSLLARYPRLHLDTTMIFVNTHLFNTRPKIERAALERYADRILFGSDFPNIPYDYEEAVASIVRLELGEEITEKIFYGNAARLFNLEDTG